MILVLVHFPL